MGLLADANPVVSMERAGTASQGLLGGNATPMQRVGYAGDMLSNMAGAVAPAMVASRAGLPAAQAIQEGLLGASQAAGVPQFVADESGALRLTRGNYIGGHSAPQLEPGASLDDPRTMFGGNDIYTRNAMQYFGTGDNKMDAQSIAAIQKLKGKPSADVYIYRAVPENAPNEIGAGDWVTISEKYAKQHGESALGGKYKIVKEKVKAGELATDGNSIHEWGWWPSDSRLADQASRDNQTGLLMAQTPPRAE
jgi:hypothetical protein